MGHAFAFLFPGQGSQSVGMLGDLAASFSQVKETFDQASAIFGDDLWALSQVGPAEKLNQTAYTQPALLAADVAVWRCWQSLGGPLPAFMAGHSLGEYAALVCSDALSFENGIKLVATRGRLMQEAVPAGEGAMAAIIGLDDAAVQSLCDKENGVVSPANFNSPGQVVIAGEAVAVAAVMTAAKEAGARMAKKLPVSVPSHCILMQKAADALANQLSEITFQMPSIPLIFNVDAKVHTAPDDIKSVLMQQLIKPVRWVSTIEYMCSQGVNTYFECGPNRVLSGLNKRISKEVQTSSLLTEEDISSAVAQLSEG